MATVAFIFPGQGSQSVGMLKELAGVYPEVKQHFEEASEILKLNLWEISQTDLNSELGRTDITQPILLTAGIACQNILKKQCQVEAAIMSGHSLGEYTALCAAGALDFSEAVNLVHMRGKIMQEAVALGSGSMAAILGLDDESIIEVCQNIDGSVSAANFNAPGQVVIAGETRAIEKAIEAAKKIGAKRAILLPVSVPSHCELMRPAAEKFNYHLDQIHWQTPITKVIHNVDAKTHLGIDNIKLALSTQLYQPVRWVECVQALVKEGASLCIEAGPGKVLTGLNKRINKHLTTLAFDRPESVDAVAIALETL